MDIIHTRLANQHLIGQKFKKPEDVVSWLGAVQAQDYAAAKWGIRIRLANAVDSVVEKAFNEGKILRTHIMRPTWHFVMPEDILWMQQLTSPQVKKVLGHYNRKLELTDALFTTSNKAIIKALAKNHYLTRQELKKVLADIGTTTDVQRLAHIISWAELEGLICSGPRRGKQFTYALLEERVPKSKKLQRDEALATLALRYFESHGPAQLKDFSWWSGLSMQDTNESLSLIKSSLSSVLVNNKIYWFSPKTKHIQQVSTTAFLLSIYDEYTIAYKDRSDLSEARDIERMISMGNALTAVLIIDGKVAGTWKRILKKEDVLITIKPFRALTTTEKEAVAVAAQEYGDFLERKIVLKWETQ